MQKKSAFTLVEIVIVVALLAIISLIGFAVNNPAQRFNEAKDTVRRTEIEALTKGVRIFYLDNDFVYPQTNGGGAIAQITRPQFQTLIANAQAGTASCSGTLASSLSNALTDVYYSGSFTGPDSDAYYVFRVEDLFVVGCSDLSTGFIYARIE